MKLKFNFLLVLTSLFFAACSDDSSIESVSTNSITETSITMNKISSINYDHVISYGDYDAGIYSNGSVDLFLNDELHNKVTYVGDLGYTTVQFQDKFRIVNSKNSSEYFEIVNVTKTSIDKSTELIEFDVIAVDGSVLQGFEYTAAKACPWCWVAGGVIKIIEVVVDATTDSDCIKAVNACVQAGGLPTTQIEEGFFSSSCTVTCNAQ